jgi:hypothetical protein
VGDAEDKAAGPLAAPVGAAAGPAAAPLSATSTPVVVADVPEDTDARAGMVTAARATTPPAIAV